VYTKHPDFDPPQDNDLLWRYFDLARYLDLLIREQLFFASLETMEDPFEAALPGTTPDHHHDAPPCLAISSWHNSPEENYAMWKIYAEGNAGLAICTTFADLRDSFKRSDKPIWIGKVAYYNHQRNQPCETGLAIANADPAAADTTAVNTSLGFYLRKRSVYAYEKEVRCCYQPKENELDPHEKNTEFKGIYIPVDIDRLIGRIYISPYAPAWFRQLIAGLNKKFGIQKQIIHSDLLGGQT